MTPLHPRVAVNSICSQSWTLDRDIEFWSQAGIERVGFPIRKLLEVGRDHAVEALQRNNFSVGEISRTNAFELSEPASWDASTDNLKETIDVAVELGAPVVYTTTGPAGKLLPDDAFDAFVRAVAPANAYATDHGVRLAIEQSGALSRESGSVHTFSDVAELIDAADIGLCVDLQNCYYELHAAEQLERVAERICMVQISDAVPGSMVRWDRAVPGDGDIPIGWWVEHLVDVGYQGPFELELLGPRIEAEGYSASITRSVEELSKILYEVGVERS